MVKTTHLWQTVVVWWAAAGLLAGFHLGPRQAAAQDGAAAQANGPVDLDEVARRDPAVAAVLELDRETPRAQLRAVFALLDLGQPGVAAEVFEPLAAAELSDAQRTQLVEHFGTARFLQLLRVTKPGHAVYFDHPAAAAFAQASLDAAAQHARDPQRLAAAVEQLAAPDRQVRHEARSVLLAGGEAGVEAAFAALARAESEELRAQLLAILAAMHPTVDQPLLAILAEGRGQVRRDAVELAGHLRLFDALPWIAVLSVGPDSQVAVAARSALSDFGLPLPSTDEARALVRRDLNRLADAQTTPSFASLRTNVWWKWDRQAQRLNQMAVLPDQGRIARLARLARALLEPGLADDPAQQYQAMLYAWEERVALHGGDDKGGEVADDADAWQHLAEGAPAAELSELLATATQHELFAAATRCAQLLQERNDPSVLTANDGQQTPLAKALVSPHQGLRFAALQAVLELSPGRPFAGSSGVADSLWYFATGAGDPTAVAAAATIPRANTWAGQLRTLGYDAVAATTGRGALAAALDRSRAARLVLVAIDSDISLPQVRETIFQLRRSPVAAHAPIAVLCSLQRLHDMQSLAEGDPLLLAEPRPHSDKAMAAVVDRLMQLPAPAPASDEVRTARAGFALEAIAGLLATEAPFDELIRDADLVAAALYHPTLSDAAIKVLGHLGTTASQQVLADYAQTATLPLDARRRAADAFAASVGRVGVQLPRSEVIRQYDRFNAAQSADPETQALLSGLLDVIEGK